MAALSITLKRFQNFWARLTALSIFAVPTLDAETVNVIPSKDTTIFSNNNGATASVGYIHAGRNGFGNKLFRSLMEFDISSAIPSGATIDSATLTMYVVSNANNFQSNSEGSLHRLEKEWGEGTSGYPTAIRGIQDGIPAQIGDATWNLAEVTSDSSGLSGLAWNAPGGDFAPTPSATTDYSSYAPDLPGPNDSEDPLNYTPIVWTGPGMINDVQNWLDSPNTNHGWLLRSTHDATKLVFGSKETAANGTPAPTLVIEYTPGAVSDGDALDDTWEQEIVDASSTDLITSIEDVHPDDDFNGDGVSNLLAYAFGYGPTEPVSPAAANGYPVLIESGSDTILRFSTAKSAADSGMVFIIEGVENLSDPQWQEEARFASNGWTVQTGNTPVQVDDNADSTTWDLDASGAASARFLRVRLIDAQ
jgi:hypothetical protein